MMTNLFKDGGGSDGWSLNQKSRGGNDSDEHLKPLRAFPSMLLNASYTSLAEDQNPRFAGKP